MLVATGDPIPGLGVVDEIYEVALNDAGDWIVSFHTDQMAASQMAFLRNGVVVLKPGDLLSGPVPAFDYGGVLQLDAAGNWSWGLMWPVPSLYGAAAFVDTTLYAAIGDPVVAPGITPGTKYKGISDQAIGSGATLVVHAVMDDPEIDGVADNVILSIAPQPGGGFLTTDLVKRGDTLPGAPSRRTAKSSSRSRSRPAELRRALVPGGLHGSLDREADPHRGLAPAPAPPGRPATSRSPRRAR